MADALGARPLQVVAAQPTHEAVAIPLSTRQKRWSIHSPHVNGALSAAAAAAHDLGKAAQLLRPACSTQSTTHVAEPRGGTRTSIPPS